MKQTFFGQLRHRISALLGLATLLSFSMPASVYAANVAITGGSNGPTCNSGGYFTPSSVAINSGDTVTISVPSNDPYAPGLEVHGFPEGNFTITPGNSHTTAVLTANVSYYGTWPSSGCQKGSGTITVSAPTPAPSPTPAPAPTPTPSSPPAAPKTSPTPSPAPTPTPTPTTTSTSSATSGGGPSTAKPKQGTTVASAPAQQMGASKVAAIAGGLVLVLAAGGFVLWRFVLGRHVSPSMVSQGGAPVTTAQQPVNVQAPSQSKESDIPLPSGGSEPPQPPAPTPQ
jgi:hypothetical protein